MILDLFAGAGGAGLGLRRVFPDELIVHVDHDVDCILTLRAAFDRERSKLDYPILAEVGGDNPNLNGTRVTGLWASPPCQPYSHAGERRGADDPRDAWPATLAVIEATRPRWVVIENVRGSPAEEWRDQLRDLRYVSTVWDLDAADFGVPQHRRRRFVVALDLWAGDGTGNLPHAPHPTHGPPEPAGFFPPRFKPFVTIGDALPHLREEAIVAWEEAIAAGVRPRPAVHPAWWHRGSPLDEPSRTIGGRGNACVDVQVRYPIGQGRAGSEPERLDRPAVTGRRRLTVEECAVLQGWPADWPFQGTKESRYRQVGNGCPPALAEAVVRALTGGSSPVRE